MLSFTLSPSESLLIIKVHSAFLHVYILITTPTAAPWMKTEEEKLSFKCCNYHIRVAKDRILSCSYVTFWVDIFQSIITDLQWSFRLLSVLVVGCYALPILKNRNIKLKQEHLTIYQRGLKMVDLIAKKRYVLDHL